MTTNEGCARVIELYDEGEYGLAVVLARQLLQDAPEDGRLLEAYGVACCAVKDFAAGRDALEQAELLVPLRPAAQFALATCLALDADHDLAALIYEHLGTTVRATNLLASVASRLGALGRYESALEVCQRINRLDPNHHQAHFGIAYYLERLGYPAAALVGPLERAAALAPHLVSYRVNLGFALASLNRLSESCTLLADVPPEEVGCPCALRRMADCLERGGLHGKSLACRVRLSCLLQ